MLRTFLLAASALTIAACGGEVTDGGTGSDTDFAEIENETEVGAQPEQAEDAAAEASGEAGTPEQVAQNGQPTQESPALASRPDDPRADDYPETGEEQTRNPIEPGNEEPGGKDMMLAREYEAMEGRTADPSRIALQEARAGATEPVIEFEERLYLSGVGISVERLMGLQVEGSDEELTVSNALLDGRGRVQALVLTDGGVGMIGRQRYVVPNGEVTLAPKEGSEGYTVTVPGGELPDFDEDALPEDTLLASEVIGQPLIVGEQQEGGSIEDVVLTADGRVVGLAVDFVGQRYFLEPAMVTQAQGDGGYVLAIEADRLQEMLPYVGVPATEGTR